MKNVFLLILAFILLGNAGLAQDSSNKIRISGDLEIVQLTPNSYLHVSYTSSPTFGRYGSNGLIYINNKEAIVMDTPPTDSLSMLLLDWFDKKFPGVTIKAVVINHFHDDCLGGLRIFHEKGIASYANYMTNESIKNDSTEKPQHTFDTELMLRVGKEFVVNRYFGEAHSRDNIVTWIPKEKILFGGCMIKSMGANRGNLGDANLQQWSPTVQQVKKAFTNAKIVIPGHGSHGTTALLDYTITMFQEEAK